MGPLLLSQAEHALSFINPSLKQKHLNLGKGWLLPHDINLTHNSPLLLSLVMRDQINLQPRIIHIRLLRVDSRNLVAEFLPAVALRLGEFGLLILEKFTGGRVDADFF